MALTDDDKKNLDSWFSPTTRESENFWVERLLQVTPLYEEHGFTKAEGAMLFMLNSILGQVNSIKFLLQKWDEEDSGDAPS